MATDLSRRGLLRASLVRAVKFLGSPCLFLRLECMGTENFASESSLRSFDRVPNAIVSPTMNRARTKTEQKYANGVCVRVSAWWRLPFS